MSEEEYISIQNQLVILAQLIAPLDLKGFLSQLAHAEAMCPILDPTLFMRGAGKLAQVRRLAEAAQEFQAEVLRQIAEEATKGETHV